MKLLSYDKHISGIHIRHHSPWKLGIIFTLSLGALCLGMANPPNVYAGEPHINPNKLDVWQADKENRIQVNQTGKNLMSSSGRDGAKQVENNSDDAESGGIFLPHSYPVYQNSNREITNKLETIHNRLEKKYLGNNALKFNVKSNDSVINVVYQNAMTHTFYKQDNDGDWHKQIQHISINMTLQNPNFYPTKYFSGTPNVFISKNFSRGIYYNGINNMQVNYSYYDANTNQPITFRKNTYLTVHGLDGIATPEGNYLTRSSSGQYRGDSYNVRHRLLPYYYTANWMLTHNNTKANNEKYFAGDAGINKYKRELFEEDTNYDQYGKFVDKLNSDDGYKYPNSEIRNTTVKEGNHTIGVVKSGEQDVPYSGDRNDKTHALIYPIGADGQDSFLIGSSTGNGNFSVTSDVGHIKKHKNKKKPAPNTPIQKSVDKSTIHRQGDNITYTLKGSLPEKHQTWHRWTERHTIALPPTIIHHKHHTTTIPNSTTIVKHRKKKTHMHDSYNFTDDVPNDASVTSVSSSGGLSATNYGNRVTAHASNGQLLANSGRSYTIKVHAKVDHLPQPSANGWNNDPTDNGYYKFSNQARANIIRYGQGSSDTSNSVSTKIKRYEGTIWHYDFDNEEDGDFDFMGHGPDGDGNFKYNDNFDPDQGVIQSSKVYGYEGDTKNVNILTNAYKSDNPQWHYRYAYGNQTNETIKFNDPGDDGDGTTQDFYFPYIVPRSKITNSLITVDTDKRSNNLPFTLDMKGESFLYRDFSDYVGTNVTVNVSSPDGSILWSQTKPLTSLLAEGQHAMNWTQWQGRLDTSRLNVGDGSRIPLNVQVSSNNPQLIQQDSTPYTATYGFTANNDQIQGKNFDKNHNAIFTSPQETLKYDGLGEPRVLSEALSINQDRNASGKTGYGIRQGNDLSLEYAGNINTKSYLDNGTGLDYDFSSSYNNANSGIDYNSDPRNHTYNVPNQSNDQGTQKQQGGLSDRFDQTNHYNGNGYNELNNKDDFDTSRLDTYNQMDSLDQITINSINDDMPLSYSQYIQPSSFKTTYDFAPRFTERGSGNVFLTQGTKDALAHNRTNPDYDGIDAGQRMYTPYFMPLGKYDTYYSKADMDDSHRLGANYFDIDENRPMNFYGHMYLTANSAAGISNQNDELSIQPIISHQQNVKGFSNQENQWLKDQSTYFNK